MIRIASSAKFSDRLVMGNVEHRRKIVADLNERFFDKFQPMLEEGPINIERLREEYFRILPERKKVRIIPLNNDDIDGASDYIYKKGKIVGVTLEIPITNHKFYEKDFVSFLHENTHVLDTLANPKHSSLCQKLYRAKEYDSGRNFWFDNFLYKDETEECGTILDILENVKNKTKEFLYGMPVERKINYLHDARYELEQESNAYSEQLKYAKRLKEMNRPVDEGDLEDWNLAYLFTQKIQLLKDMILELISRERKNRPTVIWV